MGAAAYSRPVAAALNGGCQAPRGASSNERSRRHNMAQAVATDWSVPEFSLAERDRRWGRVRELMAAAGVDAIVGIANTGLFERNQSDVRYLTQLGRCFEEVSVVFPLEGEVTAVMRTGGHTLADNWL